MDRAMVGSETMKSLFVALSLFLVACPWDNPGGTPEEACVELVKDAERSFQVPACSCERWDPARFLNGADDRLWGDQVAANVYRTPVFAVLCPDVQVREVGKVRGFAPYVAPQPAPQSEEAPSE